MINGFHGVHSWYGDLYLYLKYPLEWNHLPARCSANR